MRRRTFFVTSAAVAGGVVLGGYFVLRPPKDSNPLHAILDEGQYAITPYILIDSIGVTIITPRAEMGQGIQTTLAALVAEELDIALSDVQVIHGPPSDTYANNVAYRPEAMRQKLLRRAGKRLGMEFVKPRYTQLTGAQSSIQDAYYKMRKAGAAARGVLLKAGAEALETDVSELKTSNGLVIAPDGRSIPYTGLAASAASFEPSPDPPLKSRTDWTQLGQSMSRVDMIEKCTGRAQYAIDVRLPDMLYGVVLLNPQIGGGIESYDTAVAEKVPGYVQTIAWKDGLVVVAAHTWAAIQAMREIKVSWGKAPYPPSTEDHRNAVFEALSTNGGRVVRNVGDVDNAIAQQERVSGTYHVPYVAHATMEPLNAAAWLRDGQLDIWAGHQNPLKVQHIGAEITGLKPEAVNVHTMYMGGGFGRRLENDFVNIAIHTAATLEGTPVKVMWTRETDMTYDVYRPMASARFEGMVENGKILALDLKLSSPSLHASSKRRGVEPPRTIAERVDPVSTTGAAEQPYNFEHYRVTAKTSQRLLPVGWLRGVGESQNVFFHDSAVDELIAAADGDPLHMRKSMLDHAPSRAVLEKLAILSNWDTPLSPGHARGVAYALSSGAATAQVIEVSGSIAAGIRLEKIYAVVDVGVALDPRNIEAQVQSGIIFGLTMAMYGEITVSDGKVDQSNFHDYRVLRLNEIPPITVGIHESGDAIYGVGEAGTPTAPPALANAIFALTGQRFRSLPLSDALRFV